MPKPDDGLPEGEAANDDSVEEDGIPAPAGEKDAGDDAFSALGDSSACGIGGRDSRREAPNDDVGLKAFIPPKPVVCGCRGDRLNDGADVAVVEPVGWLENAELLVPVGWPKSAEAVEPVGWLGKGDDVVEIVCAPSCFLFASKDQPLLKENDDAISDITDPPFGCEDGAPAVPGKEKGELEGCEGLKVEALDGCPWFCC